MISFKKGHFKILKAGRTQSRNTEQSLNTFNFSEKLTRHLIFNLP